MILHTVACKACVAIFLPQVGDPRFHSCHIARKTQIPLHFQSVGFLAVFGILQAVVADDIDGIAFHLPEDPSALPGTGHEQLVVLAKLVEGFDILWGQGRFVLAQGAVQVKGDHFDFMHLWHRSFPVFSGNQRGNSW